MGETVVQKPEPAVGQVWAFDGESVFGAPPREPRVVMSVGATDALFESGTVAGLNWMRELPEWRCVGLVLPSGRRAMVGERYRYMDGGEALTFASVNVYGDACLEMHGRLHTSATPRSLDEHWTLLPTAVLGQTLTTDGMAQSAPVAIGQVYETPGGQRVTVTGRSTDPADGNCCWRLDGEMDGTWDVAAWSRLEGWRLVGGPGARREAYASMRDMMTGGKVALPQPSPKRRLADTRVPTGHAATVDITVTVSGDAAKTTAAAAAQMAALAERVREVDAKTPPVTARWSTATTVKSYAVIALAQPAPAALNGRGFTRALAAFAEAMGGGDLRLAMAAVNAMHVLEEGFGGLPHPEPWRIARAWQAAAEAFGERVRGLPGSLSGCSVWGSTLAPLYLAERCPGYTVPEQAPAAPAPTVQRQRPGRPASASGYVAAPMGVR